MGLQSDFFRGDPRLEACLVQDSAHITPGSKGDFVSKIQLALEALDDADIDDSEMTSATYGPSTADAVLDYKTARKIINFGYQTQADNIVGKMTIAALDQEMREMEKPPSGDVCSLGPEQIQGRHVKRKAS